MPLSGMGWAGAREATAVLAAMFAAWIRAIRPDPRTAMFRLIRWFGATVLPMGVCEAAQAGRFQTAGGVLLGGLFLEAAPDQPRLSFRCGATGRTGPIQIGGESVGFGRSGDDVAQELLSLTGSLKSVVNRKSGRSKSTP